jgi:hypothetical protein
MAAIQIRTITIPLGASQSELFEAGVAVEGSFSIPATFTGTTIQPQFSNDGTNWTNVGTAISIAANGTYVIPQEVFKASRGRLVSNSSEVAARTIILALRR